MQVQCPITHTRARSHACSTSSRASAGVPSVSWMQRHIPRVECCSGRCGCSTCCCGCCHPQVHFLIATIPIHCNDYSMLLPWLRLPITATAATACLRFAAVSTVVRSCCSDMLPCVCMLRLLPFFFVHSCYSCLLPEFLSRWLVSSHIRHAHLMC